MSDTFPRSNDSIATYILRCHPMTSITRNKPVTCYGISALGYLLIHIINVYTYHYISIMSLFKAVHSEVRQSLLLTFSPQIFYGGPTYHNPYPFISFQTGRLQPLHQPILFNITWTQDVSADFTELHTHQVSLIYACRSIIQRVSERYFIIPRFESLVLLT